MGQALLLAFGLLLIIEGLFPLLAPKAWKETFGKLIGLRDGQLRSIGLIGVGAGIVLLLLSS
ncbi:MAG TPA: DUF2065 domain-containing protein [Burkholderiaceae bacterium]|nr:DUF2065 domain-containing protein [Burkholderiaceae bacterium]